MKPAKLSTPDRGVGRPSIQPLVKLMIDRMESIERRLAKKDGGPIVALTAEREMLAKLDMRAGDAITLERQRVLHRAIDESYFHVPMEPGAGALSGTSTIDASGFTFEDFPAAALTARRRTTPLRALWPRTTVRFNLWYSSPVGSTNLFTLGIRVRQLGATMSIAVPATTVVLNFTAPGPAVAGALLFTSLVATGTILPVPDAVNFTFLRNGPDANANAFRFVLGEFVLMESA